MSFVPVAGWPASTVVDAWSFGAPVGRTLHQIPSSGPGNGGPTAAWDVAIPGVSTSSLGLRLRNPGIGGSGTRTAFADFAEPVDGGNLEIQLALAAWNWGHESTAAPRLRLEMIRGNDFVVAGFDLRRSAGGIRVGALADGRGTGVTGDGEGLLPLASGVPYFVGLSVDASAGTYRLGLREGDTGAFVLIDEGTIDAGGFPVHSLRFAMEGDFTLGGLMATYLDLASIRVTSGEMVFAPSAGGFATWVAGFGLTGPEALPETTLPGDTLPLLIKYVLGIDADQRPGPGELPLTAVVGGELLYSFQLADRTDVVTLVETSSNMVHWTTVWRSDEVPAFDPAPSVSAGPVTHGTPRFVRLRVRFADSPGAAGLDPAK